MKLGCSSSAYDAPITSGRLDLREFVSICARDLEVDGVEFLDAHLADLDTASLRDLKRACTERGMTIASVAINSDFGEQGARERSSTDARHWCDVAAYLGAPVVRLHAGRVGVRPTAESQGRIIGMFRRMFGERGPDRRRIWSDVAWALRDCADYASERGLMLALQNDDAAGAIVSDAHLLWQLTRDVGSPWLGSCPDPGRLSDTTALDLPVARAVLAVATLREVRDDGSDARLHWPEILRLLQLSEFRGWVVMDYAGADDPTAAVPRAARHLLGALHLLTRQQLLSESIEHATNGRSGEDDGYGVIEEAATVVARALGR